MPHRSLHQQLMPCAWSAPAHFHAPACLWLHPPSLRLTHAPQRDLHLLQCPGHRLQTLEHRAGVALHPQQPSHRYPHTSQSPAHWLSHLHCIGVALQHGARAGAITQISHRSPKPHNVTQRLLQAVTQHLCPPYPATHPCRSPLHVRPPYTPTPRASRGTHPCRRPLHVRQPRHRPARPGLDVHVHQAEPLLVGAAQKILHTWDMRHAISVKSPCPVLRLARKRKCRKREPKGTAWLNVVWQGAAPPSVKPAYIYVSPLD